MYTPENIETLKPTEVFVFGSNQYAKHSGGAAAIAAERFGALNGIAPNGLCGQSYGIITTSFTDQPVSLGYILNQLLTLYEFAHLRPDITFFVTKIGTGIAGFSMDEIAGLFHQIKYAQPANIILPKEFTIN